MRSKAANTRTLHTSLPPLSGFFLGPAGREFEDGKERESEKANNEEAHACDPRGSTDTRALAVTGPPNIPETRGRAPCPEASSSTVGLQSVLWGPEDGFGKNNP